MRSTLAKLRGIWPVFLSYCVTGYHFGDDSLELRMCRLFTRRLPYNNLRYCVTRISHTHLRVGPSPDEETYIHRAYLLTANGDVIVLRVDDTESFVETLRNRAPHIELRRKPTVLYSITLAREERQES